MTESLSGDWWIEIDFVSGKARHTAHLVQEGEALSGRYRSLYGSCEIDGSAAGGEVEINIGIHYQGCGARYAFRGKVEGERMSGEVNLGEYWSAKWTAQRAG